MRTKFTGVGTALITPFTTTGAVDEAAVRRLARRQIDLGTHFLVPCGTTGEVPTLTAAERRTVVEIVVDEAGGKTPVLAGAGGYDTLGFDGDQGAVTSRPTGPQSGTIVAGGRLIAYEGLEPVAPVDVAARLGLDDRLVGGIDAERFHRRPPASGPTAVRPGPVPANEEMGREMWRLTWRA